MQTRIELWKTYRDEIKNKATILGYIESKNEKIKNYREQIESISPKIIKNVNIDEYLSPLLSVDTNQDVDTQTILDVLTQINHEELKLVEQKLDEINKKNNNMQNNTLFVGNEMNKLWLEKNYDQYHTTIKIENELAQIEKDVLQSKYDKLSAMENIGVDDNDQEVASKIKEYTPNNKLSRFNHRKFYFSTVIVCLVLLGLLFILVFFGEFLPF